ncbi:MAG: toll/interleukin-1 receptor domain-containing protein [Bacteroidota bacterium]
MSKSRIEQWKESLASTNVIDVINAIAPAGSSGLPEALQLLEEAGSNLLESHWSMKINTGQEELTIKEYLAHWKEELKKKIPKSAVIQETVVKKVFISYSTMDRERAIKLALALENEPGISVFLDRWEFSPGDILTERLESEVLSASFLIVLLSKSSVNSEWVKKEVSLAVNNKLKSQISILIIRIDNSLIPTELADVVHVDWRKAEDKGRAVQSVVDFLRGEVSFEKRVANILRHSNDEDIHVQRARDLLVDIAPGDFFHNERNQQWLVWELFHRILPQYPLSVIIRPRDENAGVEVEFIDLWNRTRNKLHLSWESLRSGLWETDINLHMSDKQEENSMKYLGELGRLSYKHNSNARENRILPTDLKYAESEREEIFYLLDRATLQTQKEFLDMLQLATGPKGWRKLIVVIGGVFTDFSWAISSNVKPPEERTGPGILVEIWDPFFGCLKSTNMLQSQLTFGWGRDIDLFSNEWEFSLGLE